jgi:hypothetical protein
MSKKIGEKSEKGTVQKTFHTYFFQNFFFLCSYVLMTHKIYKLRWVKSCYLHI